MFATHTQNSGLGLISLVTRHGSYGYTSSPHNPGRMDRRDFLSLTALTAFLPASVGETTPSDDGESWLSFGYDSRNTSHRAVSGPTEGAEVQWSHQTDGRILSSPAVADGSVYFGSWDGKMYSVDSETGDENWSFETGERKPVYGSERGAPFPETGGIGSSPCFHDGKLYFGAYDGYLYCLDSANGEEVWKRETNSIIRSSPVVADDTVYIGDWTGKMHALDSETGRETWTYDTGHDHVYSTPCFGDGQTYFGTAVFGKDDGVGAVHAVDRCTGDRVWRKEFDGVVGSSPCLHDGVVFFGTFDRTVRAVDAADGTDVWTHTAENGFGSSPAVDGESLYIAGNDAHVYSFETETGDLNWSFEADARFYASNVSVTDEAVFVGGHDDRLYALRKTDGKLLWSFETGGNIRSMPAVFEDRLYFGSQDGVFYCLSKSEGSNVPEPSDVACERHGDHEYVESLLRTVHRLWENAG